MRTKLFACLLAAAASLGGGVSARAQATGGAWVPTRDGGWVWYTRASAWSGYAPGYVQYESRPAVAATTPARSTATATASGWQGYAPGLAWQGYAPATSWRGYRPVRAGETYSFRAGQLGLYSNRLVAIAPSSYREYGTGRNVPLSKPWLPNSTP